MNETLIYNANYFLNLIIFFIILLYSIIFAIQDIKTRKIKNRHLIFFFIIFIILFILKISVLEYYKKTTSYDILKYLNVIDKNQIYFLISFDISIFLINIISSILISFFLFYMNIIGAGDGKLIILNAFFFGLFYKTFYIFLYYSILFSLLMIYSLINVLLKLKLKDLRNIIKKISLKRFFIDVIISLLFANFFIVYFHKIFAYFSIFKINMKNIPLIFLIIISLYFIDYIVYYLLRSKLRAILSNKYFIFISFFFYIIHKIKYGFNTFEFTYLFFYIFYRYVIYTIFISLIDKYSYKIVNIKNLKPKQILFKEYLDIKENTILTEKEIKKLKESNLKKVKVVNEFPFATLIFFTNILMILNLYLKIL